MHVIIVGAGPSGLILALLLARNNIKCTLLDGADVVDERPRAAHYGPCAIAELRRAGVLDDVRAKGMIPGNIYWRKLDHSLIAEMKDASQADTENALTVLPLGELDVLLVEHTKKYSNLEIRWSHKVHTVDQDEHAARASGETKDGSKFTVEGDFVVGTDGGQSTVRKSLFGRRFDGFSWDRQLIATNVYLDEKDIPTLADTNFIMHPEHHVMVAKITKAGLWRVSYGENADLTFEEVLKKQPDKFRTMLKLEPKQYRIASCYPYRIHQRCAERFRVGRILLAADAAHIVNPHGGLGLTGGIMDVAGLAQCLVGLNEGRATSDILDRYDEVRRKLWHDIINPVSIDNMKRISSDPDITADTDPAIAMWRQAWTDEAVLEKQKASAYSIAHDFSQYFTKSRQNETVEAVGKLGTSVSTSQVEASDN